MKFWKPALRKTESKTGGLNRLKMESANVFENAKESFVYYIINSIMQKKICSFQIGFGFGQKKFVCTFFGISASCKNWRYFATQHVAINSRFWRNLWSFNNCRQRRRKRTTKYVFFLHSMGKKSTFLTYHVKKHHSTLEMYTFKVMLLLSHLARDFKKVYFST